MGTKRKGQPATGYHISPFASLEYRRTATLGFGILELFRIVMSGFHPAKSDRLAWYDRAIRAVGGTLLLLFLAAGLVLMIVETLGAR